ncbi:hypothetical protein CROQUDRAFT_713733 [Cronartium quercuum f. sp. fusiforme G11]|uniref:Uncharacterized protein n=1 Tax=Cronartium quercuum f. sp. fusiforme G11 TaxID=708437 RepID=A0A9P6NUQ4_9BASI|nr:hypothetical protein CROQUDRAFT_713733 [Cronartium quercuum f. sp. fusiforme G11]
MISSEFSNKTTIGSEVSSKTVQQETTIKLDIRLKIHTYRELPVFCEEDSPFYFVRGKRVYIPKETVKIPPKDLLRPPPLIPETKPLGNHGTFMVYTFEYRYYYYIVEKSPFILPPDYQPSFIPTPTQQQPVITFSRPHGRRCDGVEIENPTDCDIAFSRLRRLDDSFSTSTNIDTRTGEYSSCKVIVSCFGSESLNALDSQIYGNSYTSLSDSFKRLAMKCSTKRRGGHMAFEDGCSLQIAPRGGQWADY